jgi:endonuclease YncB( thermonuclease family)
MVNSSPGRADRHRPGAIALAVCLSIHATTAALAEIRGRPEILDADTFDVGLVRIRLHGIDAPEIGQRCVEPGGGTWDCGAAAVQRLQELVSDGGLVCTGRERDPYGRVIASCTAEGRDIADVLVGEGLAWAYTDYSDDYADEEAAARAAGLGIWRAETQTAWDFRADRWQRAAAVAPRPNCPIKGNISTRGDHIYHTPWSKYYSRTKIDERQGEAWFCNEAEAEAAGWRPAAGR